MGYDGYRQAFTYDANGMRQSRSEAGDANRSTLEELLRGNVAGLPEIVEPEMFQSGVLQDLFVEVYHAVRVIHLSG